VVTENPRQEADEPSVPDLHWHPKWGLLEREDGVVSLISEGRRTLREFLGQQDPSFNPPLPPDAVKLGDVEALRRDLEESQKATAREMKRALDAECERDALRAEVRRLSRWISALRAKFAETRALADCYTIAGAVPRERLLAILDCEPDREEPKDRVREYLEESDRLFGPPESEDE
jgi:hypothetical protein